MKYSQMMLIKEVISYAANFGIGLSGWVIVFFAMKLREKYKKNIILIFVENIGMLIGLALPVVIASFFNRLPYNDNILKKAIYGNIAFAMAFGAPFFLFSIGSLRSMFSAGKRRKELVDEAKGIRRTIDFSGNNEYYKVEFKGLEVFEDPRNNERVGAGTKFNDQFLEFVSMGDAFITPDNGMFSKKCRKCSHGMGKKDISKTIIDEEYKFEGMEPFHKIVSGPMYICPKCGKKMISDYEKYSEADDLAIENGKLILP